MIFNELERYKNLGENIHNVKIGQLTTETTLVTLRNMIDYWNSAQPQLLSDEKATKLLQLSDESDPAVIEVLYEEIMSATE